MREAYKVAVVGRTGHGDYGHALDTAWRDFPSARVVAVADDNPTGLAATMQRLDVRQGYADYLEMLDATKPDIVTICSRWVDRHHEMAMAAAERGVHIFMEKPFCRTLEEADDVVAECKRNNVKCVVSHPTRFSPLIDTIHRLIDEGAIGEVLEYRARGKEDQRDGRERAGAEELWVLGTHLLDMVHTIGGHPRWCFADVTVNGRAVNRDDLKEGAEGTGPLAGDTVHAMYGMPNCATAYFGSRRGAGGQEPSRYALQIYGSRGVLELVEGIIPLVKYLDDPSWSPGRSGRSWHSVSSAGIDRPEPLDHPKYKARHWLAIEELLGAIEGGWEPKGGAEESRWVTEMITGVFESHRQGRPVVFPLANRTNPLLQLSSGQEAGELRAATAIGFNNC